MSTTFDSQPIVATMRRNTQVTVEAIKAAMPRREHKGRRTLQYTIKCMGTSVKSGGPFGHKDR